MRRLAVMVLVLFAVPAWAQDKPTVQAPALATAEAFALKPDAELLILRAKVEVQQQQLLAAQIEAEGLRAQYKALVGILNQQFADTRATHEPGLLKAHGHDGDGWTWDWEAWKPKAPPPKVEPKEPEKK